MINLHHLAIFDAVASSASVTRAAEQLGISQPAISKQLRILEKSLHVCLFERQPKGMRCTPAGVTLKDFSTRIFALAEDAERAMGDLGALRHGRLCIGAGPTAGTYLLPHAIVRFRSEHPSIGLRVETATAAILQRALEDRVIDFAITETPMTQPGFSSQVLLDDVLVPVTAKESPLARKRSVTAKDFADAPFIARDSTTGPSLAERSLARLGLSIRPALTVSTTEAMKQAVIGGVGVALLSRMAIRAERAAGQLAILRIPALRIRYPIYYISLTGYALSASGEAFLQLLREKLPAKSVPRRAR